MDKWFCCCSRASGDEDTIVTDNAYTNSRPRSIFNFFRRRKSSMLSEDVRTHLLKDSTTGSSESNHSVKSTDHEEYIETDHASDPTHEQTDYVYSDTSKETTENETQVRNTRPNVEDKYELAQIYTTVKCHDLKTEQFGRNPLLVNLSRLRYVVENSESLRSPCKDMELINFSNINTKSLMSSFQYSVTPNVGYLRDLTNIPLDYSRNVASCLKIEDEYVNVQIFARLTIESFMESSSDESTSAPKRSQCPSTKGAGKKKTKKKKNKAPNVSREMGAVGAVPVVKTVQQLGSSKQIGAQPFLQAFNSQLNKGSDSAKTSASGLVLPAETETVQQLASSIQIERKARPFPQAFNSQLNKVSNSANTSASGLVLPAETETVQQLASSIQIERKARPFLQAFNSQLNKGSDSAKTSASGHVLPAETETVQQLASSIQIERKARPFLQAFNSQLNKGSDSAKTSASGHVLPAETETVQATINKLLPAYQTSIAKNSKPSTSAVQNANFECKSLEKVTGKGFLINGTVQISKRNWNCITRTDGLYYCELCKTAAKGKYEFNVHITSPSHHSRLQECPILGEFGNSLIRKVNTGLNHCAICNKTLVETYTAEHCRGDAHTQLYTLACQSASFIMCNKFKRHRLENFNVITVDKGNIGKRTSNACNTVNAASSVPNVPKKTVNSANSANSVPTAANKAANSVPNVPKKTANSANSVPTAANKAANSVPNVPKKTANSANSVPSAANKAANSVPNVPKKTANSAISVPNKAANSMHNAANKAANSVPNVPKNTANSTISVPNVSKKTANSANSVPNVTNKAANSVSNVPKDNSASNVASKASANSKVLKIESILKVAGEGVMVNQTVIVSQRSWNTFTGTSTKRYCNICLKDANGVNGFVHMNDPKHINTLKEYPILEDYELNLIRKLPNKQFFCTICSIVTKNVPQHVKTAQHCENYCESLNKTAKILLR